jgi:L-asparaginase II
MVGPAPVARVLRSGLVESAHLGHVVVCNGEGRVVAWAGDPDRVVYARSCLKPLQAAVSLAAMGEPAPPSREIAIMCSSHNGEAVHRGAVRAVLRRAGLGPEALQCPLGWPLDPDSMARAVHRNRELHNCSGKHAGMLLACTRAGWEPDTYLERTHPLQSRVKRATLAATGLGQVKTGVDGCGAPTHAGPLRAWATLFARLADPERFGRLAGEADRAVEAMLSEPYLVGGRGRLDTDVMRETGDVLVKEGAEALVCAAVLPLGLGVAVRVEDGGERAADALTAAQVARLADHAAPAVKGGGRRVGQITADVRLRRRG